MSFLEDIKRPFNLLTFAIAIVSLLTAFYFYYFPKNERQIAFTSTSPSLIYDSSVKSPNISLVDSSGQKITANTYLMSFTIWNSGRQPIEPSDVRRPITISFPDAEKILDYKIAKSVDQDVSGFSLSAITNDTSKNVLQLNWNHFDPSKGLSFQVIFSQSSGTLYQVFNSDIVGIKGGLIAGIKQRDWGSFITHLIFISFIGMITLAAMFDKKRLMQPSRWKGNCVGWSVIVILLLTLWRSFENTILPTPPL
jgi:hypothetical protein